MSAIDLQDVSVIYKVNKSKPKASLKSSVLYRILGRSKYEDLWALNNVNLRLDNGDILGVVGANGAGKSTLCLVLSRILPPDRGKVNIEGNISTLLTLGAGFRAELTGRENVYLAGAFMGYSRNEIDDFYPKVVEFAELEDAMEMQLRQYSSGMKTRLGFAMGATMKPDILLLDEVLGVGDRSFKRKSKKRLREMIGESRIVVIVSHSMNTLKNLCNRAIWLHKGQLNMQGETDEVIDAYCEFMDKDSAENGKNQDERNSTDEEEDED